MRRRSGIALGTTLLVAAVVLTMALVLAGVAFSHLQLGTRLTASHQAELLARSAVAQAMEEVVADLDHGRPEHPGYQDLLEIHPEQYPPDAAGLLSFSEEHGVAWSTNNLPNPDAVEGWDGRVVPANAVHLVGTGRYGGVERRVEAIVHLPPFPYAIAASGTVSSEGGLYVASLPADGVQAALQSEDYLPGHVASNSREDVAVRLSAGDQVLGNVLSSGGVYLDPEALVAGQVVERGDPVSLPTLEIRAFDTAGKPNLQSLQGSASNPLPSPQIGGFARSATDLHISGDLTLDGGVLFVDGNLTIEGGVRGKGAVFVTGATTINRSVTLSSANQVALASQGNVSINGLSSSSSAFQGLVYTEGDFSARNISLYGAYVANGPGTETSLGSTIVTEGVRAISVPEYTTLELEEIAAPALAGDAYLFPFTAEKKGNDLEFAYEIEDGVLVPDVNDGPIVCRVPVRMNGLFYDVQNPVDGTWALGLHRADAQDEIIRVAELASGAQDGFSGESSNEEWLAFLLAMTDPTLMTYGPHQGQGTGGSTGLPTSYRFDLNEFLTPGERMRLLLLRDL